MHAAAAAGGYGGAGGALQVPSCDPDVRELQVCSLRYPQGALADEAAVSRSGCSLPAVCAGAGLMVSRALVNQGGTVVNESNAAAALHIREDELDDRMTEDCNESDGRSTFIEWVQYLMGYAAEVTPAAGAVLLDRGQFPDELYRTRDPLAKRIQNMLDGYDDALNDCLRDPDLCLAEQFFYDPSVSCTAMQNAETMPWPDISCAESCVETMVKDQRPDLSTCSDPVTAAMIEAPTLFKSFF